MANGTETTRPDKMNRIYLNRDGEETSKLTPEVAGVVWEVIETKERVQLDLSELFADKILPAPSLGMCAAAFGINTAVGNTVGNTRDPREMVKRLSDRVESILDGEWSSGREGGPNLKYVLEAWASSLRDRGHSVTDELLASMRKAILDGTTTTKDVLANNDVASKYAALEAERAVAKAKAVAERTTGSSADPMDLLRSKA